MVPTASASRRARGGQLGLNGSDPATCYPTAATIAISWDPALGEEIGEHLGAEAASQGVHVLLGPGLNIKRSPFCGRNFEYFSEDPYLAGKMAASYVRGIQKNGVIACPKRFAANSQELRRMASDSVMDERTLQEILRDEWGFDGFVVSDWGASNDHTAGVAAGSHLEMPTTGGDSDLELVEAVKSGRLDEKLLDRRVDELLDVIKNFDLDVAGFEAGYPRSGKGDPAMQAKAVELAKKADIVLLYIGLDEISESEGLDRSHMRPPQSQVDLIGAIAAVNPNRTRWSGQHKVAFYEYPPSIIREEYCAVLEVWDARQGLALLQEFLRQQTEKCERSGSCVRRGVGEGVLLVLPSFCSITPPAGERRARQ